MSNDQPVVKANDKPVATVNEKPPIAVGHRGIELRTLEDLYRFSKYVAVSGLAPKNLRSPEAVLVALEFGLELGLSPMQAIQSVAVINGIPSIWGDTMLGLCMSSTLFDHSEFAEWFEGKPFEDSFTAYCRVKRVNRKEATVRSFSVADAKHAGLWNKEGPWRAYPKRMLQMRARSFALRDAFPDILKGVLTAEEARDIDAVESTCSPVEPEQPASGVAALAQKLGVTEEAKPVEVEPEPATPAEVEQSLFETT